MVQRHPKEKRNGIGDMGDMHDMQRFKNGSTVFVNSTYNKEERCEVVDCAENELSTGKNVYKVHSLDNYGTFTVLEDYIFATKEDAHKANIEASANIVRQYKAEIKTLKDLLEFPLTHCLACGEDYTDYEAQRAYRIRANELTGLILQKG